MFFRGMSAKQYSHGNVTRREDEERMREQQQQEEEGRSIGRNARNARGGLWTIQ
jgi:hypothetical protein